MYILVTVKKLNKHACSKCKRGRKPATHLCYSLKVIYQVSVYCNKYRRHFEHAAGITEHGSHTPLLYARQCLTAISV